MKQKMLKRMLCGLLACVLVLGYVPVPAHAAEIDGLCPHHTQHTPECGYSAGVAGSPCTHVCDAGCYQTVTQCTHVHGDCGYVEGVAESVCTHVCSVESGCVVVIPDCHHVHDDSCGYVAEIPESPCTYQCAECQQAAVDQAAADAVAALIAELPTVEALRAMTAEEQQAVYNRLQAALNAYNALTIDQKALIPNAEAVLLPLLEYFDSLDSTGNQGAGSAADVEAVQALIDDLPTLEEVQAMPMEEQLEAYNQVQSAYGAYDALTDDQKAQLPEAEEIFTSLFEYFNSLTAPASDVLASGTCGENLTWVLTDDGVLTISGTGAMANYYFPWGEYTPWYEERARITSVVLQEGVTSIGEYAFSECSSLTDITIPERVTSVGYSAFSGCSSLTGITIPQGVTSISGGVFAECSSLTSITIPDGVTSIGSLAFSGCSSLTSIAIPDGVTSIGVSAFSHCTSLTGITIPDGVTSIGGGAFSGCSSLTNITIPDEVTAIESDVFSGCSGLISITIPDGVTSIGVSAFSGCSSLTSITIPEKVTSIGEQAFNGCSNLTSVTIPEGVISIGSHAFLGCRGLTSITIPEGVTSIGYSAFGGCSSLTSITIPDGITSISNGLFSGCSSLTSITIPEGVTSIGNGAFGGCSNLPAITIPQNVSSIGERAFYSCTQLKEITFQGNAPTIGSSAFTDVTATAYYPAGNATWTSDVMQNYGGTITWVPYDSHEHSYTAAVTAPTCTERGYTTYTCDCGDSYVADYVDATGHTEETIPGKAATCTEDGLTDGKKCSVCGEILEEQQTIPAGHNFVDGVCSGCGAITGSCGAKGDNLTYILTTDGVLTIFGSGDMKDYYDFHSTPWYNQRTKITSLVVMDGVNSIGYDTFEDCTNLISVLLPNSVSRIEYAAFNNCSKLSTITIPEGLASLGDYAFSGCSSLTAVTVPEKITSIGQSVFSGCSSLKSITIPKGVSSIGDYAFSGCSSLETIIIPKKVISIGEGAFNECTSLSSITLYQGLISIGDYAFFHCESLTSIDIPEGVTSIHDSVFGWCKNLTTVTIPKGVKYIGEDVFACCDSLETVHFLGNGIRGNNSVFWTNVVAYYPRGNTTWTQEIRDSYGSRVTWVEEGAERLLELAGTGLENEQVVWIDGVAVPVQKDESGKPYLILPEHCTPILVTYSFNTGSGDRHAQYPTGMQVYRIVTTESGMTVEHIPELDNLLQYSGSSIRITGKKGIRMITSINQATRNALTGSGLAGFTLLEYGTALCRSSVLEGGAPLVLGTAGVKSNYAYLKDVADPVFKYTGGLIQYTNVLVGFSDEDCKEDIAMRPYIKLQDESGEVVTIYGGTVYRSIGYIAYQNRNAFKPGSEAYNYVWNIIHYVYGDQYDADYKG